MKHDQDEIAVQAAWLVAADTPFSAQQLLPVARRFEGSEDQLVRQLRALVAFALEENIGILNAFYKLPDDRVFLKRRSVL